MSDRIAKKQIQDNLEEALDLLHDYVVDVVLPCTRNPPHGLFGGDAD
jgi:hypothetical protein